MPRPLSGGFILGLFVFVGCAGAGDNGSGAASLGEGDSSSTGTQATGSSTGSTSVSGTSVGTTTTSTTVTTTTASTSVGVTTDAPTGTDTTDETSSDTTSGRESWNRYTLDVDAGTWSATPLDRVWSGANAPPSSDLTAAVSLTHFDRLYVLADDGTFYEQADGIWIAPVALSTRFPMTAGLDIGSMVHSPDQDDDTREGLYLVDNPSVVIYTQQENGGLDYEQTATATDEKDAAPQGTGRAQWYFAITDPALAGVDADWLQWFVAYDDGNLWKFNAAFEWTAAPLAANQFFTGAAGEPDPTTVTAAYHDDAFGLAHFIAP